ATRREIESADAQTEMQAFQREGVYLTLASNVALATIEEGRLRGQIAATQRIIRLQTDLLGVLQKQHDQGQIALTDVVTQQAALARSRLLLPPLERGSGTHRKLLTSMAAQVPAE